MRLKETQAETMKAQLSDLLISISWADLANRYFNRSGSWLYHKLDGIDGNKKPPRHSKITQPLRIENSEPSALSSINFKFSRGEEREDRSVQDAPEATPLVRVVCSVVW